MDVATSGMSSAANGVQKAPRVKVQIGVSRLQKTAISTPNEKLSLDSIENNAPSKSGQTSNTALVNFCNSAFLRTKRKMNPEGQKILTIDSDYKLKKASTSSAGPKATDSGAHANMSESGPIGPRVEIVNGQIVIKESSLEIANQDSLIAEGEYEEVEEGIHASSRYSSFLNKRKSKSWGIEETRLFYKALQQCGTEFSVMESFFPERSRKELKLKFFREESHHPELIKRALDSSLPLELTPFEEKLGEKLEVSATSNSSSLAVAATSATAIHTAAE